MFTFEEIYTHCPDCGNLVDRMELMGEGQYCSCCEREYLEDA